ncbi:MAG TPA: universal stress protein [Oculatellaceae cyanobacterium]
MKVLVAIDQSAFGFQIIEALAKRKFPAGTQFKILSVVEPLPFDWDQQNAKTWKKIAQDVLNERKLVVEEIESVARYKLLCAHPDAQVHTEIRHGDARIEIIHAATSWMPNKIILGAHGRSPNRLFPNVVSQHVARHALCTVELIRLTEPSHATSTRDESVKTEVSK